MNSPSPEPSRLEDLTVGASVEGIDPAGPVHVVSIEWHGDSAVTVTFRDEHGRVDERLLFRNNEGTFRVAGSRRAWSFDADPHYFKLAAEAKRIKLAHLFDPYIAITASQIEPLPHQVEAVYGEMIPRHPLRFLLADDPGAGKTIMAGLYIKELMLRGDLERCLIVAPGGLVAQWQEELWEKFNLDFEIVTREMLDTAFSGEVFSQKDRLIARLDQIARRDELVERLSQVDWDLVVVDEAHRMSAHYYSREVEKTKRYKLGEVLGGTARHFLLMTATPHAGKEDDFQLFLALLDADRFEGRYRDGIHTVDTSDLMRRMIKENLLRFDGTPLFPERRATTVKYRLSQDEMNLYDEVTTYVRDEMNRADRLGDKGRGNTVGFALTILQRRLASSPEAIYQSLRRRRARLEERIIEEQQIARARARGATSTEDRLSALLSEDGDVDLDGLEDLDATELENLEIDIADSASAAANIPELEAEIQILGQLAELARRLVDKGVDRKWAELSTLLSGAPEMTDAQGRLRKLIVFTEHRDTLNYLIDRLRTFIGNSDAVVTIHGGTGREERRVIQERFMQDPDCQILVATDAAGEGLNLQQAHLVVNYDLPWNPNRLEQRFGRVHRIGQTEVCHMWNLVAEDTREAHVYLRLLEKIEEQSRAYKGQVFDVLGKALSGRDLRELLVEAIRYGEQDDVKARLHQVIDEKVGDGLGELIAEEALSADVMAEADVEEIRLRMEEAEARRLQPHYIRSFLFAALDDLGGRYTEREPGRYAIKHVPAFIRQRDRLIGTGNPVLPKYERVTFDKDKVRQEGTPLAELVAPGHPLLDAVIDLTLEKYRTGFKQGAIFVDENDTSTDARVLVMLEHQIADARPSKNSPHTVVSHRFEFVEVPSEGDPRSAGHAPYLDYRPADEDEVRQLKPLLEESWLTNDLETIGKNHAIEVAIPEHIAQIRLQTERRVERIRAAVHERLTTAINYWDQRVNDLQDQVAVEKQPQANLDRARRRAEGIAARLERRMQELDQEAALTALPPVVVGGALVVPAALLSKDTTVEHAAHSRETAEVERRAIEAVLEIETQLGHSARDMNEERTNNPGYDIRSQLPDGHLRFIEVKGRIAGSETVTVSRNEILTGLNTGERFVLALVEVLPDGGENVRYVVDPFRGSDDPHFAETSRTFRWTKMWDAGFDPLSEAAHT